MRPFCTLQALRMVRHSALQFCGYSCLTLFTGYEPKDMLNDPKIGEKRPTRADTKGRNSLTECGEHFSPRTSFVRTCFYDVVNPMSLQAMQMESASRE